MRPMHVLPDLGTSSGLSWVWWRCGRSCSCIAAMSRDEATGDDSPLDPSTAAAARCRCSRARTCTRTGDDHTFSARQGRNTPSQHNRMRGDAAPGKGDMSALDFPRCEKASRALH